MASLAVNGTTSLSKYEDNDDYDEKEARAAADVDGARQDGSKKKVHDFFGFVVF
jgi:hypothetical protein